MLYIYSRIHISLPKLWLTVSNCCNESFACVINSSWRFFTRTIPLRVTFIFEGRCYVQGQTKIRLSRFEPLHKHTHIHTFLLVNNTEITIWKLRNFLPNDIHYWSCVVTFRVNYLENMQTLWLICSVMCIIASANAGKRFYFCVLKVGNKKVCMKYSLKNQLMFMMTIVCT